MNSETGKSLDAAIESRVRLAGDQREILCADALAVATELGVDPKQVGARCNQIDVKIQGCQLGCFE